MEQKMNQTGQLSIANKRIVVVDDDESIRKTFFLILHENYRVYLAKDSAEALQRFSGNHVDLIITDYRLPGMNGLDMVARFRESGFHGQVILISADSVAHARMRHLSIHRFFVKPLDLHAIKQAVDDLISRRSGHAR